MKEDLWMVEAMIQPFKLESVTMALAQLPGFVGLTATDCRGFGQGPFQPGRVGKPEKDEPTHAERRTIDIDVDDFAPKVKLEIAVTGRDRADAVVDSISRAAHTGRKGDGRIFMWPITRAVRVRTFESDAKPV